MSVSSQYPEAVWCMHCSAGSRMSFMPDPLNFHCPYCNQWNHLDHKLYIEKPFTIDQSSRISLGISQIGGKYRLLNKILAQIPYHEFYLEPFLGSGIVLANKPRCRYECGNDINSALINYHLMVKYYPKEFDEIKQGVFGTVSQDICNRIVRGEIVARNNLEAGYFFYYLNKLTFGGSVHKGFTGIIDQKRQNPRIDAPGIEKAKENYAYITKGNSGIVNTRAIPQHTLHKEDFENIKAQYSDMLNNFALGTIKEKQVEEAKAKYTGMFNSSMKADPMSKESIEKTKQNYKKKKAAYCGIHNTRALSNATNSRDMEKWKKDFQIQKKAAIKGINPKTTRPYTNNDCGLLSPLEPEAIKRLRYVNLTCYTFQKVYKMFYEAFHVRKGLGEECFVYFDPPYPKTEKYYKTGFNDNDHLDLIKILLDSPFHCLLSIGIGKDCLLYTDTLKEAGWIIESAWTKHSTDANTQKDVQEFLCMNYDISRLPLMMFDYTQKCLDVPAVKIRTKKKEKIVNKREEKIQKDLEVFF